MFFFTFLILAQSQNIQFKRRPASGTTRISTHGLWRPRADTTIKGFPFIPYAGAKPLKVFIYLCSRLVSVAFGDSVSVTVK